MRRLDGWVKGMSNGAFAWVVVLMFVVLVGLGFLLGRSTADEGSDKAQTRQAVSHAVQEQKEQQLDRDFDRQMEEVVPLLREYQAHPSVALAERIGMVAPLLTKISLTTGAVTGIKEHLAEEILSYYGQ